VDDLWFMQLVSLSLRFLQFPNVPESSLAIG
jgi:hypothetical protein